MVVVIGETGSGKSTKIPQIVHEAFAKKVVVSQPRRVAVVSLAERVGQEVAARGRSSGTEAGSAVGYKIRLKDTTSARARRYRMSQTGFC